jgi:large subunit ribosomal protein L25
MVANAVLRADIRDERGKGGMRKLRQAGRLPAVLYGHGETTRTLTLDTHEVERLLSQIAVENTVITLRIDDREEVKALIREVQSHPSRPQLLHLDFYQVHAGESVNVVIPVRLHGNPRGVREGGVLQHVMHDIAVRCRADSIPESIDVDVAELPIGGVVHVRDLVFPPGLEVQLDPDLTVCSVVGPTVAAVEGAPEEAEGVGGDVEPEVIGRRPGDEDKAAATEGGST